MFSSQIQAWGGDYSKTCSELAYKNTFLNKPGYQLLNATVYIYVFKGIVRRIGMYTKNGIIMISKLII